MRGDICDAELVGSLLRKHRPRAIVHFAAESHVDRSIVSPEAFIRTNVLGTFTLLEQARVYWAGLDEDDRAAFRFLHVSTDEVYGTLGPNDPAFSETTAYAPNSPYAASKAGSDHLARAYFHTFGLPVLTTNCSNNYGPFQFPEKLIPLMILNALEGKPLPVYGDGKNVRDWLFVEDHCAAIRSGARKSGRPGETYNIGGNSETREYRRGDGDLRPGGRDAAGTGCRTAARAYHLCARPAGPRPALRDRRAARLRASWAGSRRSKFESGLRKTVRWYLEQRGVGEQRAHRRLSRLDCEELRGADGIVKPGRYELLGERKWLTNLR